jgi:hypothetical protein
VSESWPRRNAARRVCAAWRSSNGGRVEVGLDEASKEVLERLANGPLGDDQRHALARQLVTLLPLVADDLQAQEDMKAATNLLRHLERWEIEAKSSGRLDVSEAEDRTLDETDWS